MNATARAHTHAQTDGQREDIMPLASSIGGGCGRYAAAIDPDTTTNFTNVQRVFASNAPFANGNKHIANDVVV